MRLKLTVLAMSAAFALAACNDDGDSSTSAAPVSGVFLDAAVEGLAFTASPSGLSGTTSSAGRFSCQSGDVVTFKIGGVELGKSACAATVTPLDLAAASGWRGDDDKVNNRLLFIQSLDDDDNPANGIRISAALASALTGKTLDFSKAASAFDTDMLAVLPTLADAFGRSYNARVPNDTRRNLAKEHFESTLASALGQSATSRVVQASAGGEVAITKYVLNAEAALFIPYEGVNGAAKNEFPGGFFPAVGSGLAFKGKASDGSLEFYGITDRGPNGDSPNAPSPDNSGKTSITKMFPAPSFTPSIGLISVGKAGALVKSLLPIRQDAATKLSGRPLASGETGSSGEVPLNDRLQFDAASAGFDANGLDPESLIYDAAAKVFWTSDEYAPFIAKIDAASGIVLKKYKPGTGASDLPDVLKNRRANRGMEGLTMQANGKLHGFLQSPIDPRDSAGSSVKASDASDLDQDGSKTDTVNVRDFAQFARWLEFDPVTEKSRLYAYPLAYPLAATGEKWDRNRTGSAKLGDVIALANGKFIVIEQGTDGKGKVRNFLMLVEIPGNVTDIVSDGINLEKNSIDGTSSTDHPWSSLVTLKKTLLLDLNAIGWSAEKAEGLALVDAQTLALINDNDFGLRTILTDANGNAVEGDITECTVDAQGVVVNDGKCPANATGGRVTRGSDQERPTRLWLIKLPKALSDF